MTCRVEIIDLQQWLIHAKEFHDYNYTHYWEYARYAACRIGATSEHIAVYRESGELLALSDIRIKRLPFRLGGIAYISGGPMVDRGQRDIDSDLKSTLSAIKGEFVNKRGYVLRISQRHKISSRIAQEDSVYRKEGFAEYGKTNATMLIDLSYELDDIRKRFHQKWRNMLNKSERQGIGVLEGTSVELFNDFSKLFKELVSKKGFEVTMDDSFYATVQQQSLEQEKFHLAVAYIDGTPVGGHLSSICGDTSVYLMGATNDLGRKLGAAYLLQWNAITRSKKRGMHWYDLGGVDKYVNPHVYLFKERMGGILTNVGCLYQSTVGFRGRIVLALESTYIYFTKILKRRFYK